MNDKDLKDFIKAFDDFMKHYDVEQLYYEGRKVHEKYRAQSKKIMQKEIEKKAAQLEVTCDYYMMEFM